MSSLINHHNYTVGQLHAGYCIFFKFSVDNVVILSIFILLVKYNIKMKIGEIKGNGADGNVYIQLFGSKGSTAKIQLRQAGDEKNRFEKDQEYKFMVTTLDIGKVSTVPGNDIC